MTIKEIQESSSYEYIRHDSSHISVHGKLSGSTVIELGSGINVSHFGPQSLRRLNANAVQLSASLNIKGIGRVKDAILRNQDQELLVDTALDETDRWVIQTKFETPMLNFSHVSGSDHITFPVYVIFNSSVFNVSFGPASHSAPPINGFRVNPFILPVLSISMPDGLETDLTFGTDTVEYKEAQAP